jgi:hypothetical protein
MGRTVNLDERLSAEDKQYLIERGRSYLIPANERRFGTEDEPIDPVEGEEAGAAAVSPFYDSAERDKAVYDVGGAPLPGTILDKDTGRVFDRDNGVLVEYSGPGHTPNAYDLSPQRSDDAGFNSRPDEGDEEIDEDIAEYVLDKKQTKDTLKAELDKYEVEYESDANKPRLQELLALKLQDDRDDGKDIKLK